MNKRKITFIIIGIVIILLIAGFLAIKGINAKNEKKAEEILKDYYRLKLSNQIEEVREFVTDNVYSENNIYDAESDDVITKIAKTTNDVFVEKDMYFKILDSYKTKNTYIIKYQFIFPDYTDVYSKYASMKNFKFELVDGFEDKIVEEIENDTVSKVTLTREAKIIKVNGKLKIDDLGENINED